MWKSKMKRCVSILTSVLILGSLTPSIKAQAKEPPRTIRKYSETKPSPAQEIEENGIKYKLKGEPKEELQTKKEPPSIIYDRQYKITYQVINNINLIKIH